MKKGAARHNWKIKILDNKDIIDECPHCGIQRRVRTNFSITLDGRRVTKKNKINEFLVNGKWQGELPDCKRLEVTV